MSKTNHGVVHSSFQKMDLIELLQSEACNIACYLDEEDGGCDNNCDECMFDTSNEEAAKQFEAWLEEGKVKLELTVQ